MSRCPPIWLVTSTELEHKLLRFFSAKPTIFNVEKNLLGANKITIAYSNENSDLVNSKDVFELKTLENNVQKHFGSKLFFPECPFEI